jgi:hypothetical protein
MIPPPSAASAFCLLPTAFAERLDVFSGAANPAEARIYARLELAADELNCGLKLSGRVVGPDCAFSHTLPARMPMMDRSGEGVLLLEAVVPDPCFWTPELPFLYRAEIELGQKNETIAKAKRTIGVRRLGVRNGSLNFDGKRFVLRGVQRQLAKGRRQNEAAFCRETWTTLVVSNPDDELCEIASRSGVLLVADLAAGSAGVNEDIASTLRRLARWPAVALAILDQNAKLPAEIGSTVRSLLLAARTAADEPLRPFGWAQVLVVEASQPKAFVDKVAGSNLPIVAYRRQSELSDVESARAACDALQRDLASCGDFAGYLV